MDQQTAVQKFFYGATGIRTLTTAVLQWQADQGYVSDSVTLNWMAIAQDIEVPYHGDIDMQNRFASGQYEIPAPEEP